MGDQMLMLTLIVVQCNTVSSLPFLSLPLLPHHSQLCETNAMACCFAWAIYCGVFLQTMESSSWSHVDKVASLIPVPRMKTGNIPKSSVLVLLHYAQMTNSFLLKLLKEGVQG